jgi:hypothetical protein
MVSNSGATLDTTSALTDSNGTSSFTVSYAAANSTGAAASSTVAAGTPATPAVAQTKAVSQVLLKLGAAESTSSSDTTDQAAKDQVLASLDVLLLKYGLV